MRAARRAWPIIATSAETISEAHTSPYDTGLVGFSGNGRATKSVHKDKREGSANIAPASVSWRSLGRTT